MTCANPSAKLDCSNIAGPESPLSVETPTSRVFDEKLKGSLGGSSRTHAPSTSDTQITEHAPLLAAVVDGHGK